MYFIFNNSKIKKNMCIIINFSHIVSDINYCENVNCTGRGNCTNGVNTYTCVCEAGYTGTDCETGKYCTNMKINY